MQEQEQPAASSQPRATSHQQPPAASTHSTAQSTSSTRSAALGRRPSPAPTRGGRYLVLSAQPALPHSVADSHSAPQCSVPQCSVPPRRCRSGCHRHERRLRPALARRAAAGDGLLDVAVAVRAAAALHTKRLGRVGARLGTPTLEGRGRGRRRGGGLRRRRPFGLQGVACLHAMHGQCGRWSVRGQSARSVAVSDTGRAVSNAQCVRNAQCHWV
jgi:hypothetical protein